MTISIRRYDMHYYRLEKYINSCYLPTQALKLHSICEHARNIIYTLFFIHTLSLIDTIQYLFEQFSLKYNEKHSWFLVLLLSLSVSLPPQ